MLLITLALIRPAMSLTLFCKYLVLTSHAAPPWHPQPPAQFRLVQEWIWWMVAV